MLELVFKVDMAMLNNQTPEYSPSTCRRPTNHFLDAPPYPLPALTKVQLEGVNMIWHAYRWIHYDLPLGLCSSLWVKIPCPSAFFFHTGKSLMTLSWEPLRHFTISITPHIINNPGDTVLNTLLSWEKNLYLKHKQGDRRSKKGRNVIHFQ